MKSMSTILAAIVVPFLHLPAMANDWTKLDDRLYVDYTTIVEIGTTRTYLIKYDNGDGKFMEMKEFIDCKHKMWGVAADLEGHGTVVALDALPQGYEEQAKTICEYPLKDVE